MEIQQLSDIDIFFNYGDLDLDLETQSDLIQLLLQPSRSMFYNRSNSAGTDMYENSPNTLLLEIGLRYDIASAINRRNYNVGDGNNGTKDRRVAVSQFSMSFEQADNFTNATIYYIPYADTAQIKNISAPVGAKNV